MIRTPVLFLFLLAATGLAKAETVPEVIESARKAAVEVLVEGIPKGGGAFVSEDGHLITAAHLFDSPEARFEVITAKDERLSAQLVAFDKGHDLALMKVAGDEFPAMEVAKAVPEVGVRVFNFGNALRNRGVVLEGTVALQETVFNELAETGGYIENFYVSAMTPSLTSGGVWINGQGRIVGVQSARLNDGAVTSGVAIVVPPTAIAKLLRRKKNAATSGIGAWVWEVWTGDVAYLKRLPEGSEGVLISTLHEGGPLDAAGLKRLDVIVSCDGRAVRRRPEFLHLVRAKKPGEKVVLEVLRPDVEGTGEVEVVLSDLEKVWVLRAGGTD